MSMDVLALTTFIFHNTIICLYCPSTILSVLARVALLALTTFIFRNTIICLYCPSTILFVLARVCIWLLGCCKLEVLNVFVGSLECFFSSGLWQSYCALVFGYLMQLLSYYLQMKKCSLIFLLESESGLSI